MSFGKKNREVIVLCPNGRRVTIKTDSSSSIGQIIEEACLKQKFDPQSYNLKHLKRCLDPSTTLQYANIPNHAQLELIEAQERRKELPVTVNLVTDTGQRLITDFPSSSTLWDVLLHHDQNSDSNFSLPSDPTAEEPFIVYTMRKIIGEELRSVTLKSLGLYGGRCMMRYNVQTRSESSNPSPLVIVNVSKKAKTPQQSSLPADSSDAHQDSPPVKVEFGEKKVSEQVIKTPSDEPMECDVNPNKVVPPTVDLSQSQISPPEPKPMECDNATNEPVPTTSDLTTQSEIPYNLPIEKELTKFENENRVPDTTVNGNIPVKIEPAANEPTPGFNDEDQTTKPIVKEEAKIIPLSDHDSVLFSLDDAPPVQRSDEGDGFFELTSEEVKKLYREHVKLLKELEEAPLMTQQLRQLEKDSRLLSAMNRHPVTQIRLCFPDRHVIQANFKPRNTIREVMEFLRPLLVRADLKFYLYTTFPRKVLQPDWTLVEAGCIPKARLYFGTEEEGTSFLSEATLKKKSSFEGASQAVIKSNAKSESLNLDEVLDVPQSQCSVGPTSAPISQDYSGRKPSYKSSQQKPKWFKLGK